MGEIYPPEEDSFLLVKALKENLNSLKNKKILDMGSGSGIISQELISWGISPKKLTLTDINPDAIKKLKKDFQYSEVTTSNLFEKLNSKFDIIIFNPPYLPEDKNEPKESRIITTGGKEGSEIINKFLKDSKTFLNKNGKIFLLVSTLSKGIKFRGFKKRLVAKEKLFFEELLVYLLTPLNPSLSNPLS